MPGNFRVAPYIDILDNPPSLASVKAATGISTFTLAFITNNPQNNCLPSWGSQVDWYRQDANTVWNENVIDQNIAGLRAAGGDALISFGGAANQEPALVCTNVTQLTALYQAVIDRYSLTRIDFDIEGAAQLDHAANARRGQAVKNLEAAAAAAGKTLTVTYTLPVLASGLVNDGLTVVNDTKATGARIDLINVMAMDYGSSSNSHMGQDAIDAATNTANQMSILWPSLTPAQRLAHIGVCPMIATNDDGSFYSLSDAAKLNTWAKANGLGLITWWSVARDPGYKYALAFNA